jgi:hypothetical protein
MMYAKIDEPGRNKKRIARNRKKFGEMSNRRPKPAHTPAIIRPSCGR